MLTRLKGIFGFGQKTSPVIVDGAIEAENTYSSDTPVYPIGKVDFNKPLVVFDDFDDEMENVEVIIVLDNSRYPVVVSFWEAGSQYVAAFNTDGDSEHQNYRIENISDHDDQDDGSALDSVCVNGINRRVGDTVRTYRRGFGYRDCTIVKIRSDSRKSLYVNPNDGNKCYWALNKNVIS